MTVFTCKRIYLLFVVVEWARRFIAGIFFMRSGYVRARQSGWTACSALA